MKLVLCLITIFLLSNCNAQEIVFSNDKPSKNEEIIIPTTIGNDNNLLCFTEKYENDSVSVNAENKSIYFGKITTDQSLGAARGVMFDRNLTSIYVEINDKKLKIKNIPHYRFIYL